MFGYHCLWMETVFPGKMVQADFTKGAEHFISGRYLLCNGQYAGCNSS